MKRAIASIDRLGCWCEWWMLDGSERRRARAFTITRLDVSRSACTRSLDIDLSARVVCFRICQSYMHVNPEVYDRGFSLILSALHNRMNSGDSLLLLPEGKETDTRDLDDLESDTGNISLCLSSSTETRDKNFIVLVGLLLMMIPHW
jgi:hypothetical protein